MEWHTLQRQEEWLHLLASSFDRPVLVFKHSTRCSLSDVVKARFERYSGEFPIPVFILDLLKHRDLSDQIASQLAVHHESPQILFIRNGECVLEESHGNIFPEEIVQFSEN
ncbi:MAG TPA: bacillithiol system redox-active protein YtxJ [Chitinophagaceae bacterium]|nr:bacillithiol system redox-active protein YtxJ [Chitinophagaceae bacterium]HNF71118.1 bacillithiol system redox-active protein YtxJ [Chitinophagaceae bacterium]